MVKLITDVDLSQLFETCPEKGLEVLMDMHMGLVYTIVYSKLYPSYSREDIEECVSDVFLEAFKRREDLVNLQRGSIKAYLAVMAGRRAIDVHRRLVTKAVNAEYMDDALDTKLIDFSTPEETFITQEAQKELVDAIIALGEPDSEILIRKYYLGQKTKEISKLVHLKNSTVDTRASRGLAKLKKMLGGDKHAGRTQ